MTDDLKNFIVVEKVDSTNNYAMAMVQKAIIKDGDAIFALQQTSGKGRRGKSWSSAAGENILLTVVRQMQWMTVYDQFRLSVAVSLACYDFAKTYVPDNLKIKWPNDIYINDRKAGGILIENVIAGQLWLWSAIGVGLNINQLNFDSLSSSATSLRSITGNIYDVMDLARELHEKISDRINKLRTQNFDELLDEYNQNLYGASKKVTLKKGPAVFATTVKGVNASGELITTDTMERTFLLDEVEWLM